MEEKFEIAWEGFKKGKWNNKVNVSDFIKLNYTAYLSDETFLEGPTEKTTKLWEKVAALMKEELEKEVSNIKAEAKKVAY